MGLRSRYSKYEGVRKFDIIGAFFFSAAILAFITAFDVVIHDTFVLPTYHCDQAADAQKPECQAINSKTSVSASFSDMHFQYEWTGRQNYWLFLNALIVIFGLLFFFVRGYWLGSLKAGALWAISIILPIMTGFEDVLYFVYKGQSLPAQMPWLNSNVFIGAVAGGQTVTPVILYETMAGVLIVLALAWFMALRKH